MAGKVEPGRQTYSNGRKNGNDSGNSLGVFVVFLAFTVLVVISVGISIININQRIRDNEAKINHINGEISKLDRELTSLDSQYAACTTREFISSQITRFGLRLRPTPAANRRNLAVYSSEQLDQLSGRVYQGYAVKRGK